MKILVFIDHDIMIRHFIDSGVFRPLAQRHQVTLVLPQGSKRVRRTVSRDEAGFEVATLAGDDSRLYLWRTLFQVDQMRLRPGRQARALRRVRRAGYPPRVAAYYTILGLPGVFALFRQWVERRLRRQPYRALEGLIDAHAPDIILHPSVMEGIFINDLIACARRRRVPSVVIVNSWDNPSTKRAMVGCPDWLLVWGEQTWRHAQTYAGMPAARVIRFGAAQFDVYRSKPRIDRKEFCRRHGVEPSRRILLYAGSSKGTDEYQHLKKLDRAIDEGSLGRTTVVYRPHPWGNAGKNGGRIIDHPWKNVVIEATMRGYLERVGRGEKVMSSPDYADTHDLLSAIDALLSPLSTIILEAAMHGKPVMCFLPDEDDRKGHFAVALPLVHFDDMFAIDEIIVARGDAALLPAAARLMARVDDPDIGERLKQACAYFVEPFDGAYGERLAAFVEGIAGANAGRRAA